MFFPPNWQTLPSQNILLNILPTSLYFPSVSRIMTNKICNSWHSASDNRNHLFSELNCYKAYPCTTLQIELRKLYINSIHTTDKNKPQFTCFIFSCFRKEESLIDWLNNFNWKRKWWHVEIFVLIENYL